MGALDAEGRQEQRNVGRRRRHWRGHRGEAHDPYAFGKFLCKLLLDHDSYDALPKIVGCFKDLAALGVEVPAAGKFLEELARFDIVGDNEFSQDGLTLADITTLFSSNLYLHYRRRRLLARFEQAHAAEGAARQKLLCELCSAKDLPQTIADTVHSEDAFEPGPSRGPASQLRAREQGDRGRRGAMGPWRSYRLPAALCGHAVEGRRQVRRLRNNVRGAN